MCGRCIRKGDKQRLVEHLRALLNPPELPMPDAVYTVAPTTHQPIIRQSRKTGGGPVTPDVITDASGKLGEVRFTVDHTQVWPHGLFLINLAAVTSKANSKCWCSVGEPFL
jgi:hypothetical protein